MMIPPAPNSLSLVLSFLLGCGLLGRTGTTTSAQVITPVITDPGACYQAARSADRNKDSQITKNEYGAFLQALGPPGFLDGNDTIVEFAALPFSFQISFNTIACLCQFERENPGCCDGDSAHISIAAANPNENLTATDISDLLIACGLANEAIHADMLMPQQPQPDTTPTPSAAPAQSSTPSPTSSRGNLVPVASSTGLSGGAKAGLVVACLAGVAIGAILVLRIQIANSDEGRDDNQEKHPHNDDDIKLQDVETAPGLEWGHPNGASSSTLSGTARCDPRLPASPPRQFLPAKLTKSLTSGNMVQSSTAPTAAPAPTTNYSAGFIRDQEVFDDNLSDASSITDGSKSREFHDDSVVVGLMRPGSGGRGGTSNDDESMEGFSVGTLEDDRDVQQQPLTGDIERTLSQDAEDQAAAGGYGQAHLNELEAALQDGDWAGVGMTAALLATTTATPSDMEFDDRSSLGDLSSRISSRLEWREHLDSKRAEELENMIEAGNWEAIVETAAQLEAEVEASRGRGEE